MSDLTRSGAITEKRWLSPALYGLVFLAGLAWTVSRFVQSPGVPLHDEVAHFLFSRDAWQFPERMLSVWGRPAHTILYMVPSLWGLTGARVFSLVLASLTVLLATRVAPLLGVRRLFLIPVFLWFQPWFNDLSYTALTEVPFSFLLILGIYLWLSGREVLASLPLGLLALTRHEGIVLLALWGAYALYRRNWWAAALLALPLVAYNLVYFLVFREWAAAVYFVSNPTDHYGAGGWLHYVRPVVGRVGVPVTLLSLLALVPIARLPERGLAFAGYILYYLIHTILYRFGLYASGGYALFLLPLAPGFAIAAAMGVEQVLAWISHFMADRGAMMQAASAFVGVVSVLPVIYTGLQTPPPPAWSRGRRRAAGLYLASL